MKLASLKKVRVVVSLIFLISVSALFMDYGNIIPLNFSGIILYLQFTPSLIKFINLFTVAGIGFIFVLILTILFGRVYCSSICPLGTLQDIISRISNRFKRNRKYRYTKPHSLLRYSILVATIVFYLTGSIFFVNLLDPYSNYGKVLSTFFRPAIIGINNLISSILEKLDIFWLYPYEFRGIETVALIYSLLFFGAVFYLSFKYGRLYCNTICPVGTLLGFLSKYSLFKIAIDKNSCKSCGICERVCKSNCIDSFKNGTLEIDFSRCVGCFNCLTVCPSDGVNFKRRQYTENKNADTKAEPDKTKREFILKSVVYLIGLSGISFAQQKIVPKKLSKNPIYKKYPVSPPGSKSIEHFKNNCTACHLCVSACPTQVLQPSYLEYGFLGMLQPTMNYEKSFCNFDCNICTQICPTGAISILPLPEKKLKQIGKVNFIQDNCIVYTENTDCGACSEHCPTKAVFMVPYKNLMAPKLNQDICIGCGACEHACPVRPYKAIYVDGNPVHLTAKKPEVKKIDQKVNYQEDFPF